MLTPQIAALMNVVLVWDKQGLETNELLIELPGLYETVDILKKNSFCYGKKGGDQSRHGGC